MLNPSHSKSTCDLQNVSKPPSKIHLNQIPSDCLSQIFWYFSIREKLTLQLVCHKWQCLLCAHLKTFQNRLTIWYPVDNDIDSLAIFRKMHAPFLLIRRELFCSKLLPVWLFTCLRKLRLLGMEGKTNDIFINKLFTQRLVHLALLYCDLAINPLVDKAINRCPLLKEIEILSIGKHGLNESTLDRVLKQLTHLDTLRIGFVWNNVGWSHSLCARHLPSTAHRFRVLQLNDCINIHSNTLKETIRSAATFQRLKSFQFDLRDLCSGQHLELVCRSLPCLESLVVCVSRPNCVSDTQFGSIALLTHLRRLELVLRSSIALQENTLEQVMISCTQVKMFGIVHFGTLLTKKTLFNIAKHWPELQTLIFRCNHSLNPCALNALRSMKHLKCLYLFNNELGDELCSLIPCLPCLQLLDVRSARFITQTTISFLLNYLRTRPHHRFHLLISDRTKIDLRHYRLFRRTWPSLSIHQLSDSWPFPKYAMVMHENFRHFYEPV